MIKYILISFHQTPLGIALESKNINTVQLLLLYRKNEISPEDKV